MILYTVRARNDLYEIENYLELLNQQQAVVCWPRSSQKSIVRYPDAVFYETSGDDVVIVHVRHTARAPIDPETDL